jgi:hypothetical protein
MLVLLQKNNDVTYVLLWLRTKTLIAFIEDEPFRYTLTLNNDITAAKHDKIPQL